MSQFKTLLFISFGSWTIIESSISWIKDVYMKIYWNLIELKFFQNIICILFKGEEDNILIHLLLNLV